MKTDIIFKEFDIVRLIEKAKLHKELNVTTPCYVADGLRIGQIFTIVDSVIVEDMEGVKQFVSIESTDPSDVFDCYPSWCFELVKG